MKRVNRAGKLRITSICTTVLFLSSFCFFTPMAAAMGSCNGDPLREDIVNIVKGSLPLYLFDEASVVSEMEKLLSVTMGKDIEPQQSGSCADAQLMFSSGIALLLLSALLSQVVSGGECANEGCIGNLCVCIADDFSHPFGVLSNTLRLIGVTMLGTGVVGSLTCDNTTTTSN